MAQKTTVRGYEIPDDVLNRPEAICLALAGAGMPASAFDNLVEISLEITICQVDYLVGAGPWNIQAIASSLVSQLRGRSGSTYLVGHSLASGICLLAAAELGDALDGLYVCDSGLSTARHRHGGLTERIVRDGWTREHADDFVRTLTKAPLPPQQHAELLRFCLEIGATPMVESTGSLRTTDLSAAAAAVTVPTVIGYGIHDARRPLDDARAMRDIIPGARLHLFDTGHSPMVEAPREHADLLAALVAEKGR